MPEINSDGSNEQFDRRVLSARAILALLSVSTLLIGAYGVLAPGSFYRTVVGVDALPPYNQHLVSDVGGLYFGFGIVFAWAAVTMGRDLVRAVCAAWIVVQLVHSIYHGRHLHSLFGANSDDTNHRFHNLRSSTHRRLAVARKRRFEQHPMSANTTDFRCGKHWP